MGKNCFSLLIFSEAPNKKAKDDENKEDSMEDEWDSRASRQARASRQVISHPSFFSSY